MDKPISIQYEKICAFDEAVSIRPATLDDYDAFVQGYAGQRPKQSRFDEGHIETSFMTQKWYEELLIRRRRWMEDDVSYMFGVFRISDGVMVGFCDVTTHMREAFQYARIGYTIFNQYWNNSYAKHMIRLLIVIGFDQLNFHRLEAYIDPENELSKRVATHGGMRFEATRNAFEYDDGVWRDRDVYCIQQDNWKEYEW